MNKKLSVLLDDRNSRRLLILPATLIAAAMAMLMMMGWNSPGQPVYGQGTTVEFTDAVFVPLDWSLTVFEVINGGTVVPTQELTGGNPDEYGRILHTVNEGAGSTMTGTRCELMM